MNKPLDMPTLTHQEDLDDFLGTLPIAAGLTAGVLDETPKPAKQMKGVRRPELIADVDLASVEYDPDQPRKHVDHDFVMRLADSISELGMQQLPTLREVGEGRYMVVLGEQRIRAVQALGWDQVRAYVTSLAEDPRRRTLKQLAENYGRKPLTPGDVLKKFEELEEKGTNSKDAGRMIGMSETHRRRFDMVRSSPEMRDAVVNNEISLTQAEKVVQLERQQAKIEEAERRQAAEPELDPVAEPEAEADVETAEPEPKAETGEEPELEHDAEAGVEAVAETGEEPELEHDAEAGVEAVAETDEEPAQPETAGRAAAEPTATPPAAETSAGSEPTSQEVITLTQQVVTLIARTSSAHRAEAEQVIYRSAGLERVSDWVVALAAEASPEERQQAAQKLFEHLNT